MNHEGSNSKGRLDLWDPIYCVIVGNRPIRCKLNIDGVMGILFMTKTFTYARYSLGKQ